MERNWISAIDWRSLLKSGWQSFGASLSILLVVILWFVYPLSRFTWAVSALLVIHGCVLWIRHYHRRKASVFFVLAGASVALSQVSAEFVAQSEASGKVTPTWHAWVQLTGEYSPWVTLLFIGGGLVLVWMADRQSAAESSNSSSPIHQQVAQQAASGTTYFGLTVINQNFSMSEVVPPQSATVPDPRAFGEKIERSVEITDEINRLLRTLEAAMVTDFVITYESDALKLGELMAAHDARLRHGMAARVYTILARFWYESALLTPDNNKSEVAAQRSKEYLTRGRQFGDR